MERNLAVLIDFENIATGCEKEGLGRFDVRIVMRRLKDKGRITVGRSYADWGRWSRFKLDLVHEGITMVELTSHGMQSKNRADIALAVDAMELAYTRSYIETFVILSGDSDFTPLVMRLKELNKRVIGCGTRRSTSRLIAETCDEFLFYDTLRDESRLVPAKKPATPREVEEEEEEEPLTMDEGLELLVETLENLQRDEPGAVHASVLKASMKRKEPTFSEVELGVRTFAQFLEAAQQKGIIRLFRDERAGGFRVDFPQSAAEEAPAPPPRREPSRTLSPEAQRLQGLLAEAGLEIGEPRERRIVVEQFVHVCGERARRNRTCAVQFVLGDLLRRCKQEAPEIAPRTVKAVTHALRRAGLLIHPNGDAALSQTAPFVAPESAPQLLDELHAAGLRALQARGENPDDAVLTELFVGAEGLPYTGVESEERFEERRESGRDERREAGREERRDVTRGADERREAAREERREPRPGEKPREGGRDEKGRGRRGGRGRGGRREGEAPSPVAMAEELGWPALIGEPAPVDLEAAEPLAAESIDIVRGPAERAEAASEGAEAEVAATSTDAAPEKPARRGRSRKKPAAEEGAEAAEPTATAPPEGAPTEAAPTGRKARGEKPARAEKPADKARAEKSAEAPSAKPARAEKPSRAQVAADAAAALAAAESPVETDEDEGDEPEAATGNGEAPTERRRRRRGGRRGRGGRSGGGGESAGS